MKLRDYMAANGLTAKAFAESVGSTEFAVTKWVRGERRPSESFMARIADVTGGEVMPNDFFDLTKGAA